MDNIPGGGSDMSVIERSTHMAIRLMHGEALSARQIAAQYGISRQSAYYTLGMMSRVVPLVNSNGLWRLLDTIELCDE